MIKHKTENFRALAYMPLHYGYDYLEAAIDSVIDAVDEILVLYSSKPSYGHAGAVPLPQRESRDSLYRLFLEIQKKHKGKGKRFKWSDVTAVAENQHRDLGHRYAKANHYELSVALDADEVWDTNSLLDCFVEALVGGHQAYRTNHEGWWHFYRSFNECCRDGFQPVRIFNYHNYGRTQGLVKSNKIYHMGYAVKEDVMRYKLSCHGHKNEINVNNFIRIWQRYDRQQWGKYLREKHQRDRDWTLHPASKQVWINTELFNKEELPVQLAEHDFYHLTTIV